MNSSGSQPHNVNPHPSKQRSHNSNNHNSNGAKSSGKPSRKKKSSSSSQNGSSSNASSSGKEAPFEKLNTLKLLYDCGHLTEDEYKERKDQIINEMTGTSSEMKPKQPTLQPIMKTVVPHNPPDFSQFAKERAEKLTFDCDTLEWESSEVMVKIDLVPFSSGQLRTAYFMQEFSSDGEEIVNGGKVLVCKFCIEDADTTSYLWDVQMQAVCAHYAKLYNEHDPPLKVNYAGCWLLKLKDRNDIVCCVEEFIPGLYVKYSNNSGFVGTQTSSTEEIERERNTPHAFSHFTFVASDYKLMVVDVQGVHDNYTDPQIHTRDGQGFGAGNLGTAGMEKFLTTHRCNEVCRWLGLRSLNKKFKPGGTAAPNYRMPHGVIKKSTSRITEERNTFSNSNTVSEVLGTKSRLLDQYEADQEKGEANRNGSMLARFFCCGCG